MKEYIVTFKSSYQISPDDFKVYNPSMKVTETTTVKEIDDFSQKFRYIADIFSKKRINLSI